jgi:hypothetical protein
MIMENMIGWVIIVEAKSSGLDWIFATVYWSKPIISEIISGCNWPLVSIKDGIGSRFVFDRAEKLWNRNESKWW